METSEHMLVEQITVDAAKRIRDAGFGLYEAMRIMGYVTVALAEVIDLEGPAERYP
jgi:hypothetical protein